MFQKVIIAGNLGGDPVMRYTADGTPVTSFSVATSERWSDRNTGERRERTTWWRVSAWRKQAEICNEYLSKGRQVLVEGTMAVDAETGKLIWQSKDVDRSISGVVIKDDLLYIPDFSGNFTCVDIKTGKTVWQFDMGAGTWCASPMISGDRIYISNEKNVLWTLKTGRQKEVLGRTRLKSMGITPVEKDGIIYLATQRRFTAYTLENKGLISKAAE